MIILGATGAGKTFLACSLGVAANRNFYAARYLRLPDLLVEIAVARRDGTYREYMKHLKKVKLLILDGLLYPLKEAEARDVLELVEARNKVASTIFCSQYGTSEWHENPDHLQRVHGSDRGRVNAQAHGYDRVISPAAGCTMCPATVHHLGGVRGPTWWCMHHGLGVGPAKRVSVFSGQGVGRLTVRV